jgi:hypothetical protein
VAPRVRILLVDVCYQISRIAGGGAWSPGPWALGVKKRRNLAMNSED